LQRSYEFTRINPEQQQGFTRNSLPFFEEGDNNMFRKDLIRIGTPGFSLGLYGKDLLYPPGKTLVHISPIYSQ
jgi:hypothetical protein